MNKWILCFLLISCVLACKSKRKAENNNENKDFFAVLPFLLAQVKHIDTSLYRITKIEITGKVSDTTVIPRESFRNYAKDFINIPDIGSNEEKNDYNVSNSYDADLQSTLLTYTATDPDKEIRRETVMLEPDPAGGVSNAKTIIINSVTSTKDSTIIKDMTWHVSGRFQVVTKIQKAATPEEIKILQVKWE